MSLFGFWLFVEFLSLVIGFGSWLSAIVIDYLKTKEMKFHFGILILAIIPFVGIALLPFLVINLQKWYKLSKSQNIIARDQ